MASLISRRLCRALLLSCPKAKPLNFSYSFCTKSFSPAETSSDTEESTSIDPSDSDADSVPFSSTSDSVNSPRALFDRPLENGMDIGIYKAILVGQVGQAPVQKTLKGGRTITLLSLGTGGIRNNRRTLDNEDPRDYADRCAVQWHRVSVYPEKLAELAMKTVISGSILYVEGNLETKIFNDPITGLVRRIREIAIRRNGRLLFLGKGSDTGQPSLGNMRRVGYY